jgi:putative ABC transport system permease protein
MPPQCIAVALIRAASVLVPRGLRREWREEWLAELGALGEQRSSPSPADPLPGAIVFALGAFPHALYVRAEDFTMDSLLHDVRYAVRLLARAPAFTLVAAATLALGIGANGSIFTLVNGILLRAPGGIQDPERLVQIARSYESAPRWDNWSVPMLHVIGESGAFSGVAGYWGQPFVMGRSNEAEAIFGQVVTGDYFGVLRARPFLGRLLEVSDDTEPTDGRVVLLSHALWVRRFGEDPSVLGRTIILGTLPFTVVGVARPEFTGSESMGPPPQLWVTSMHHPESAPSMRAASWNSSWIEAVGRLAEGVTYEEAVAAMDVVSTRMREAYPPAEDIQAVLARGVGLDPLGRQLAGRFSMILLGITGLLLLLTCTNVATLSLARAAARRTEVGVRMTLGANRGRVARQLVTEGVVLALLATLLAVPVVLLAHRALPLVLPGPVSVSLSADARVLLFLSLIGLGAGVLFSAAPAWLSARANVSEDLREGAGTGTRGRTRLRDTLVVAQLAMSLGLIAGAALLGRSVINARTARPGFDPENLQVGFVDPQPTGRYDPSNGPELLRAMIEQAQAIPGVVSATWANQAPLVGGHSRSTVRRADQPDVPGPEAEYIVAGPRYFETMGIRILRGRALRGLDEEPERVVVVNQLLADMFWPGEDPIGKEIGRGENIWRVVGVSENVQMRNLRQPANPGVYYPLSQAYAASGALVVRTAGASVSDDALRAAVAAVDPELPVTGIQDFRAALSNSVGETRTIAYLIGSFATLALVLASVGLYGVVSYGASQRVREMGVRIALGARPGSLVRLILARAGAIALIGTALGVGLSLLLGRAIEGLLFGVAPSDGATLGGAALLLIFVAGGAAWIPARRASRADAAVSLRG